jgi:hypothetical protein
MPPDPDKPPALVARFTAVQIPGCAGRDRIAMLSCSDDIERLLTWRLSLPLSSEFSAEQYLEYAQKDFQAGQERGLVNALGNAKRALHLTIDTLPHDYGLLARNKRCDFGQKLRMLDACDLISLSIFRKLNVERNMMGTNTESPARRRSATPSMCARRSPTKGPTVTPALPDVDARGQAGGEMGRVPPSVHEFLSYLAKEQSAAAAP